MVTKTTRQQVSDGEFVSQAALVFNFTMEKAAGSKTTHILQYVIDEGGSRALDKDDLWAPAESGLHFILMENQQPGLKLQLKRAGQWTALNLGDHFEQQDVLKSFVR
jgi:hypothetical protein